MKIHLLALALMGTLFVACQSDEATDEPMATRSGSEANSHSMETPEAQMVTLEVSGMT